MISILQHIKLLRPLNLLTGAFTVVVCASILDIVGQTNTLLLTIIVIACFNGGANAYNDVLDYNADKLNRPNRPLISGIVSLKIAVFMAVILFIIGASVSFFLPHSATIIAMGVLPLLVLYSHFLKGTPLVGNAVVAFILGLTFIFIGAAFENIKPMIIPALLAVGLTFVRELVKDMADIKGDSETGLNTFPVKFGLKQSSLIVAVASCIIGLGSFAPYLAGIYGLPYLIILVLGVEIPLTIIAFTLIKSPEKNKANRFAALLKFSTIAGLLAFYADVFWA